MIGNSKNYNIVESIKLIQERIINIQDSIKDYNNKNIIEKYFIDSVKLNLIEIGEEFEVKN